MRDTGAWKDAVVAITEVLSAEVDLGAIYSHVLVLVPTINASFISIQVADDESGTYFPVHDWKDSDGDSTVLLSMAASTGGRAAVFFIGGAQYIKLLCSGAQNGGERTFRVRGIR